MRVGVRVHGWLSHIADPIEPISPESFSPQHSQDGPESAHEWSPPAVIAVALVTPDTTTG
jgi:hypothetical protein